MEIAVEYLGGTKFEVAARGHRLICDQPVDNGGGDAGISPPEFLLASLGTCAAYYATQYLKTRSIATAGCSVKVSAQKAQHPARLASFEIQVTAPGLNEAQQTGMERAVKACLIHNTLLNTPKIDIAVNAPDSNAPNFGAGSKAAGPVAVNSM